MTRFFPTCIPLVVGAVALAALYSLAVAAGHGPSAQGAQSPFYCDKDALSPAERTRHFDVLGPALVRKRQQVQELPDGYQFRFASDQETYQQIAEYVEGERRCCPFFDISLRVAPEHGPLWLRFTGRPGTKQFIQADAQSWIKTVG